MRRVYFSRESTESRNSMESIRSNQSILSRAGILTAALLAAASAQAGSHTAQSAAFRVDTRAATSVKVTGLSSRWCDGPYGGQGRHVYFLEGVGYDSGVGLLGLPVAFTAQVDWGGRTGSRLEFNGVNNGLNYSKSLDMSALSVGGKLEVVAVATDGTRSAPFRANFDVVPLPPFADMVFYAPWRPGADDLAYITPEFDIKLFKGQSGVLTGCPLPGETMDIAPKFKVEAEFKGDGTLTIKSAVGENNKIKINDSQRRLPNGTFGKATLVNLDCFIEGEVVAVWDQQTTQWKMGEGYLGVEVSGNCSTAPVYINAVPPVYVLLKGSADADFGVRVRDLGTGDGWTPEFDIDASADVKGFLGCGWSRILAGEGYFGGEISYAFMSPPERCTGFGATILAGVDVVVLGQRAPLIQWDYTY